MNGSLVILVVVLAVGFFAAGLIADGSGRSGNGFASRTEIARALSLRAVRKTARYIRPSLEKPMRAPAGSVGIAIGHRWGQKLYANLEAIILVLGPTGAGKTKGLLTHHVIDHDGPVFAASNQPNIYVDTARLRAERPIYVFNPEGMGQIESSFRWSPIEGCEIEQVAMRRAGYLIAGSSASRGVENKDFWSGSAWIILRCYLLAAATANVNMNTVMEWAGNFKNRRAIDILDEAQHPWAADLRDVLDNESEKTLGSIKMTLGLTLQFMADPVLQRAVTPEPGVRTFHVGSFLRERGTLYLLGSHREFGAVGPLLTAFTGHLFDAAFSIGGRNRLDPPLLGVLDEIGNIVRVPLDDWVTYARNRGVPLIVGAQSEAQLDQMYGEHGRRKIVDNAMYQVVFGGLNDEHTKKRLSEACGEHERHEKTHSKGGQGNKSTSMTTRKVPTMTGHQISTMGRKKVLILARGMAHPVKAKVSWVQSRKDYKAVADQPFPRATTPPVTPRPSDGGRGAEVIAMPQHQAQVEVKAADG